MKRSVPNTLPSEIPNDCNLLEGNRIYHHPLLAIRHELLAGATQLLAGSTQLLAGATHYTTNTCKLEISIEFKQTFDLLDNNYK